MFEDFEYFIYMVNSYSSICCVVNCARHQSKIISIIVEFFGITTMFNRYIIAMQNRTHFTHLESMSLHFLDPNQYYLNSIWLMNGLPGANTKVYVEIIIDSHFNSANKHRVSILLKASFQSVKFIMTNSFLLTFGFVLVTANGNFFAS